MKIVIRFSAQMYFSFCKLLILELNMDFVMLCLSCFGCHILTNVMNFLKYMMVFNRHSNLNSCTAKLVRAYVEKIDILKATHELTGIPEVVINCTRTD